MSQRPYEVVAAGQAAWRAGDVSGAERLLRAGVDAYRSSEPDGLDFALGRLGALLLAQDRVAEATAVLREAVERGTDLPAVWQDYLQALAFGGDPRALLAAADGLKKKTRGGLDPTSELLAIAKRADKAGESEFAQALAQAVFEDAEARRDKRAKWRTVGVLGGVLERKGDLDDACAIYQRAFDEGSDDPVTADRLSMAIEKKKDYAAAAALINIALTRGLPANVEERLRKRQLRCEAKLDPAKPKRKDVAAWELTRSRGHGSVYAGASSDAYLLSNAAGLRPPSVE